MPQTLKEKRARQSETRRAEGKCLSCGKPAAPLITCAECGRRANLYRKAKKAP